MNISDKKGIKLTTELIAHRIVNKLAEAIKNDVKKSVDVDLIYAKSRSNNGIINATISFDGTVENAEEVKEFVDSTILGIVTVDDLKKKIGGL